tara:strand:- start:279 stop:983 length:705 start_codon:yes stop_codon:yes gene_type:complete
MKLLVDAGNSAVKLMLATEQSELSAVGLQEVPWSHVEEVLVSAVAESSALTQVLALAAAQGKQVHYARVSGHWQQLQCAYENPNTLGIDRWLAVIAGYSENPQGETVIVDAGTALTVDVVNSEHQHLGGYILPGLDLTEHSIVSRAQKVFSVDGLRRHISPGRSTPSAVKNGALLSALGAVEYVLSHYCHGDQAQLYITGGDGLALHNHLKASVYRPHFVFEGLLKWRIGAQTV